jgi:hypothetical protein
VYFDEMYYLIMILRETIRNYVLSRTTEKKECCSDIILRMRITVATGLEFVAEEKRKKKRISKIKKKTECVRGKFYIVIFSVTNRSNIH